MSQTVLVWSVGAMSLFTISLQHTGDCEITEHYVERGVNVTDHVRPQLEQLQVEAFITNEPLEPIVQNQTPAGNTVLPAGGNVNPLDLAQFPLPSGSNAPFGISLPTILSVKEWVNPAFGVPIVEAFTATEVTLPFVPNAGPLARDPTPKGRANVLQFDSSFNANKLILQQLKQLKDNAEILTIYTTERVYENMVIESFQMPRSADTGTGSALTLNFKELRIVQSQLTNAPVPAGDYPRGYVSSSQGTQAPTDNSTDTAKSSSLAFKLSQLAGLLK